MEDVESSSNSSRIIHRIWVEGYDTGLEHDDLKGLLFQHFASCGRVSHVHIPVAVGLFLNRFAFVYLLGESSLDKALQLNGSTVGGDGGWIVMVKPFPFRENYSGSDLEAMNVAFPPPSPNQPACADLMVTGFDTFLSEDVVFNAVRDYFSSCGRVLWVSYSRLLSGVLDVDLCGGDVGFDNALRLSGRDSGGWNFVVYSVITPCKPRRIVPRNIPTLSCLEVEERIAAQQAQFGPMPMPPPSQSYLESREYKEIMARLLNVPLPHSP